ncbi:hypothetical protein MPSEU_000915400 [Mayamaea pseudoterrestris]|nr:hypothetical protein MPSEU_000915400 [Mayamaea pseudoterrestris]
MPHVELPQAEFKIALLGDSNSGKTSLVLRFVEGFYRDGRSATIGAFFLTKRLTIDTMICKLLLWDTAGQEPFQKLAVTYYKQAAAVIICYDVTKADSLERLQHWLTQVQQNMGSQSYIVCVAACKTDLAAIPGLEEDAKQLALDYGALHVSTSAKTDRNVSGVFYQTAEQVLQRQQQDAAAGSRVKQIAVTMGANMQLPRSPRRMRSLSPPANNSGTAGGSGRPRLNQRGVSDGALLSNANATSSSISPSNSTHHADEKKEDDAVTDKDSNIAPSRPGIMCDGGLLVCGSDINSSGIDRCIIL